MHIVLPYMTLYILWNMNMVIIMVTMLYIRAEHHVRMIIIFIEHGIYMILQSPNKPCIFMVLNGTFFCIDSNPIRYKMYL